MSRWINRTEEGKAARRARDVAYRAKMRKEKADYYREYYAKNKAACLAKMAAYRARKGMKVRAIKEAVDDLPVVQRWLTQEQWYEPSSGVR